MKTIQIPLIRKSKSPTDWNVIHRSEQATMAISGDHTYLLLVARVQAGNIENLNHFTDGQVTCYINEKLRREYLEIDETGHSGSFVTGYLNHRPMRAYAILAPDEMPARMVLVSDRKGQASIAELRQLAISAVRGLALKAKKQPYREM